jgi:hypothetical protein
MDRRLPKPAFLCVLLDHYIQFDQPQVVIDAILGEMPDRPAGAE